MRRTEFGLLLTFLFILIGARRFLTFLHAPLVIAISLLIVVNRNQLSERVVLLLLLVTVWLSDRSVGHIHCTWVISLTTCCSSTEISLDKKWHLEQQLASTTTSIMCCKVSAVLISHMYIFYVLYILKREFHTQMKILDCLHMVRLTDVFSV